MENIKNIIFDYGNVIFSIDFKRVQQAFKEIGIENVDEFYGHLQQDPVFDAFERGNITAHQFRERVREKANKPELTDEEIDNTWNKILIGIEQGNHELLLKLKDKYRTFLLSNINEIHLNYIQRYLKQEFNFDGNEHLFEKVYYSHLSGKRKPQIDFFEQVLQENNLKAEETLFIDDSPQHLAGARQIGIQTYLMKAPDTLQLYFSRNGLI